MGRSLVIALALLVPAVAGGRVRVEVTGEVGPELDTNAHRVQPIVVPCAADARCVDGICLDLATNQPTGETCVTSPEDPTVAGLFRVIAAGRLRLNLGRHVLTAGYGGGGKLFWGEGSREADEVVHRGDLGWATLLPAGVLSLEGSFYDAYQRESVRDFRTGMGAARMTLGRRKDSLAVTTGLGYRGLQYKPFGDYSFHGPQIGLQLASSISHGDEDDPVDWNLHLSYWLGLRQFFGNAEGIPRPCPDRPNDVCNQLTDTRREDLNHVVRAEVNYLGNADATLWYSLEVNQSNSHGETYSRHVVGLKFTTPLAWSVFLTVKGALQFSRFRDPYLISRIPNETFITIEDENRSRLVLQLARDLTSKLAVTLRYSLFVNESVTQADTDRAVRIPDFIRQTLFLGLRFEYGN